MNTIRLGIIGLGNIASGVLEGLQKNHKLIKERKQIQFEIICIAIRNLNSKRQIEVDSNILTIDPNDVINHPSADIIVELMGGVDLALEYVTKALNNKKSVVTANKALISQHGAELFELARKNEVGLFFEASVAGGVPIIKALRSSLVANAVDGIQGILNGTCNYILSQMELGINFQTALKDAQNKGYAEADPSLDIDGIDAAHKAAILASLVYGRWFNTNELIVQGIRGTKLQDINCIDELGYKLKLIANIKKAEDDTISVTVKPTLINKSAMLSLVNDVFNAVKVQGNMVGDTLFYGHGAGKNSTASAVCADIIEAGEAIINKTLASYNNFTIYDGCAGLTKLQDLKSHYYIRFTVKNYLNSVITNITQELGKHGVSIASIHQPECSGESVSVIILTHYTLTQKLQEAVELISRQDFSIEQPIIYPVDKLHN